MDKNALVCDSCERAVHRECSGLSPTELRVMDLKGGRLLKFLCVECQEGLQLVPKLYKIIDKLQSEMESLTSRLDKMSQNNTEIKSCIEDPEEMYGEIADRVERSRNVIIYNIPESQSKDFQQRIIHDQSSVSDTLKDMNVVANNFRVARLGRPGTRPRPIKVIFSESSLASQCLKQRKNLRSENNIRLRADLTIMQRDYIRKIYGELDDRKANGENNLIVKFIRGVPRIVVNRRNNNTNSQIPKN